MAPNRHAALEPEQQMLPDRLDTFEPTAVYGSGDAGDEPSRMWRGRRHAEPHERAEPRSRAVK